MKKHILYLSNSYPLTISGVTTVVRNLLTWMSQDYEVGVICPSPNTRYKHRVINHVNHYFLPSYPTLIRKDARFITPNPLQLQKAFDDFQPDLIHLHDPSPASIVLRDLAVKNNIPVIFSHHFTPQMVLGYLPESVKTLAQNSEGLNKAILQFTCKIYEKAHRIVVPTETIKDSLSPFTSVPISVISSGIDYASFQKTSTTRQKALAIKYRLPIHPFVFYLGRLDPEKNVEILLQAWSQLSAHYADFRLVIAGDGGAATKLKALAKNLGINRQVIWTGLVDPEDVSTFYQNPLARAFVITSPIESQSIATLMALASGLPVIAARAGALPELVVNGKTGYLCPPDDPTFFAQKIDYILEHPSLSQKMSYLEKQMSLKHDFLSIIKKYLQLYHTIIS